MHRVILCTRGDIPSAAAAARLLHYCYYYSYRYRPMRARRPEVAVNSYAGPIARLPIIRTDITAAPAGDIWFAVCTRTTAVAVCRG